MDEKEKEFLNKALEDVIDPELYVDIVSLGLVYGYEVKDGVLKVIMTLTFPGCPYGPTLKEMVKERIEEENLYKSVEVELTFDPPWSPDKIDPDIRAALNI